METPPPAPQQPAAPQQTGFYAGIRRLGLWRSDDHWFGGVAGGIAERLGVDVLIVRGIFVVTVLLGGVGLLAYGIGWMLLPHRRDGRILLEEVISGRFDYAFLGALAFTIVGLSRGGGWLLGWPGMPDGLRAVGGLLWLGLFAVVIAVVVAAVAANRSDHAARQAGPPPASSPWTAPQPPNPAPAAAPWAATSGAPVQPEPHRDAPYASATYPAAAAAGWSASTATAPPPPTPTGYAPAYAAYPSRPAPAPAPVPVPTVATKPRKPRPSGPGVATTGAVVALSLLTLAGLLVANRAGDFRGPIVLTALGVAIVLAGLGIVVSGLRGRTSGVLGFLAIVGLILSVPLGVAARSDWATGGDHHAVALDVTPVTRAQAERGWSFAFGDSTVDLTDVPLTDETLTVPVALGAGNLRIVVPASGAAVDADVRVGAGTITWDVGDGSPVQVSGGHLDRSFSSLSGAETHRIHLRISAGAGDVVIEQEHS
ncbi:PspC domain-containing protein [Cellulomonas alba]|uniref:PspC domain-containing protein n=1 Tax=Cellulomonas alba TaxID=3053467 RepID=A0ABT7SDH2_9CELL|nr:PspC domain-containing protein [Cellulomonas alba]MDM7854242.1 PspC domain-containing protein [Cellulomonas alba]